MNDLEVFMNKEFGNLTVLTFEDGEPWFLGKDVASALAYNNPNKAIKMHVDKEDVRVLDYKGFSHFGNSLWEGNDFSNKTVINESGLYSLIFSSKLDSAKKFKHWVTAEVIPSIRKNGGYIQGQEELSDDELLSKALLVAQSKIAERDKRIQEQQLVIEAKTQIIEEQKPLVEFANHVSEATNCIDVGQLSKIIKDEGIDIGRNRLFDWLRKNGYLMNDNTPYQKYINSGLFEVIEVATNTAYGSKVFPKTVVTGKGQIVIVEKIKDEYRNK